MGETTNNGKKHLTEEQRLRKENTSNVKLARKTHREKQFEQQQKISKVQRKRVLLAVKIASKMLSDSLYLVLRLDFVDRGQTEWPTS